MAKNRVIYQSEALYVSKRASSTAEPQHKQLTRVQSANFSYTINRQDVNQFGNLARIDSLILDPPTVTTDFSYYLTDGYNERLLGFYVQTGAAGNRSAEANFASGHLIGGSGFNSFIVTGPEGDDLNGTNLSTTLDDQTVVGIGNCYLSDYSIDLSVGSLPTASITLEGANVRAVQSGKSFLTPAIIQSNGSGLSQLVTLPDPEKGNTNQLTALRPGDIDISISSLDDDTIVDLGNDADGAHVQSVSISLPLSRSPIQKLGSRFPYARPVDFPVTVTCNVSAIVNETTAFQLADNLNADAQNVTITLRKPNDNAGAATVPAAMKFTLKKVKVDSESFSSSIGSNKTVDLTFSTQIGGANDSTAGLFVSGNSTDVGFEYIA